MEPGVDFVGVGVGALIFKDGKALMFLRTDKCRNNRGKWSIPGGMMEPFETMEEALKREVKEETGLDVVKPMMLSLREHRFDGQHWITIVYLCTAEGEPENLEKDKHEKMEWLDIEKLPGNTAQPSVDAIAAYKRIIDPNNYPVIIKK